MTTPNGASTGPATISPVKKYGPLVGILVVLAVIAGAVTLAGKKDPGETATRTTGTAAGGQTAGATSDANGVPITYEQAKAQGKESTIQWEDDCDTTTGRIKVPSVYAPACLPKTTGNGGATGTGVTADKITVVVYVAPDNNDIISKFTAQLDDKEKTQETTVKYAEMFQRIYNTYGRKVELVRYDAKGAPNDPTAAAADAVNVAEQFKPFASLGGPALTPAYAEELARRKIICMSCGLALPDAFYQANAPYIWGQGATAEEFLVNVTDFIQNKVLGKKAEFAGDDDLKNKERTFGVVHFEQDPPVFSDLSDTVAACGKQRGWEAAVSETYLFDVGKMPERATTIIAKMKAAGVTTIVFLGDPIMPIYLTQQATAQNYHPEWIVTGTVLTDTTVLGRMYDQTQWRHAFGLSGLPARIPREQTDAWNLHVWFHGTPPTAANTSGIIYAPIQQLFTGIHMAGPNLSAETFKQGLFNYPQSGGTPTSPHVSFGDHGYFTLGATAENNCKSDTPRPDYLGTDDMTEIWWDGDATGPDEQGKTDKPGMWRYANNGKRYLPGQMPKSDLDAFKPQNTITVVEAVPASDRAPQYPAPAKQG